MDYFKYKIDVGNDKILVGIITNTYNINLAHILKVTNELQKDYPELDSNNINVKFITKSGMYARQFIFDALVKKPLDCYQEYTSTHISY